MKRLACWAVLAVVLSALPGCNWGREGDLTEAEKNGLHNPQLQPPAQAVAGGPRMVPRGGRAMGAADAPGPPETMEPAKGGDAPIPGGPPTGPPAKPADDATKPGPNDEAPRASGT